MNKLVKNKIRTFAKRLKIINHLGGKCKICGDKNPFHLVCHHIVGKECKVSEMILLRWSKIKKEIEKCELLCENCHQELHYNENSKTIVDFSRRKDKIIYLEYKGTKCERCGYDKCEASLCFHHKCAETKKFSIGALSERIKSLSEVKQYIIEELNKCEVICRNCHVEEHTDTDFFNKYEDEILYKVIVIGSKEKQKKLPREEVYKMYDSGMMQKDIAKHFNASNGTISDILKPYKKK